MHVLFKLREGFTLIIMHYLFFNMGQVKLSMDKYLMVIYLSLGKYKPLLFPHPCFQDCNDSPIIIAIILALQKVPLRYYPAK